jgi:transglutaminase-like putative cysteine protease
MNQPWWQQLRSRLKSLPASEPEDSVLFRVLTQALVSLGILATDIAAETHLSVWAIPLSMAGAAWSWYGRRKRNIPTKFLLAIAMLGVLGAFFSRLLSSGQLNDTRLLLAEFLIQIQVLHSFDLPRRKDLGYSMIIGLILLGVASTLSQTMLFGVLLLAFLAIALPVLMLDYRSRLGLNTAKAEQSTLRKFNVSALLKIFLVSLLLGLAIFAVMPRFPGYQLRSLPVSTKINIQEKFNNQQITNPGYVRSGKQGFGVAERGGKGRSSASEEEFYYGFADKINQNRRATLKPQVVMRVRSQAEGFWRVMAFDRYTGQGWEVSRNDKTETLKRPDWSYQFYVPRSITLNKTKDIVQTYTIVSDLPNLIPALAQPKELYFPTTQVALDPEGGLRSPVNLSEGLTYSVISEVPYRDRSLLQKGSTYLEVPKGSLYLQLPASIEPKIRQLTEDILATSSQPLTSTYEKALYLGQYLKQRYTIQLDVPLLTQDEDLVEAFLTKRKGGSPDHFSTTLTVMLRSIGIPCRLVAGFASGRFNPFTGLYEVRNTDAYAMTEIKIPKFGWFTIDPIPGHELIPPSIEDDQTFTVLQRFWKWVAGWLPSPVAGGLNWIMAAIGSVVAAIVSLFSKGWIGLLISLILAIGLGFLGWLTWQGWQKWRYRRWLKTLPPMEGLYRDMLDWQTAQGFRKHPAQTPSEYAQQSHEVQPKECAQIIQKISDAYVSWRYGGQNPDLHDLRESLQAMQKSGRTK